MRWVYKDYRKKKKKNIKDMLSNRKVRTIMHMWLLWK